MSIERSGGSLSGVLSSERLDREVFEAWEGSENMVWATYRGGFGPPRRWQTTFRRPHPVIPRQVAPQQSLLLFHWTKSDRFPFPLPRGPIGRERKREDPRSG